MLRRRHNDADAAPTRRQRLAGSRFGQWAGRRPFVGGAAMVIGGVIVLVFPYTPVPDYVTAGVAIGWYDPDVGLQMVHPPLGWAGGIALVVCGALTLRRAGAHRVVGLCGVVAGFASFLLNHLGGFVVGMLLGIVGGALTFAWVPGPRPGHADGPDDTDDPDDTEDGRPDDSGPDVAGQRSLTDPEFFSLVKR